MNAEPNGCQSVTTLSMNMRVTTNYFLNVDTGLRKTDGLAEKRVNQVYVISRMVCHGYCLISRIHTGMFFTRY